MILQISQLKMWFTPTLDENSDELAELFIYQTWEDYQSEPQLLSIMY